MAVEQHREPEPSARALDQGLQLRMIGPVQRLDPTKAVRDRDRLFVDRLGVADHAGNRAEPDRDPQRAGVGELGQAAVENLRVEFVGLAVHIEIGARKERAQQRRAKRDAGQEQFVDEGVLRAAQRQRIEPGGGEKALADRSSRNAAS